MLKVCNVQSKFDNMYYAPTTNFEKQWEKGLKFKKRSGKFVGYCTFVKTQINVCQLLQICHCPANKLCKSNFWQINRFFKKKKKKATTKLWLQNLILRSNYFTIWSNRSWKNNLSCFYFLLHHLCFMHAWKVVFMVK